MNEGVKLLLERMDSHPEEFWPMYKGKDGVVLPLEQCRFFNLVNNFTVEEGSQYRYLDPEDFDALKNRINKFRQEEFSQQMFNWIIGGADLETKKHLKQLRNTPSATQTHGLSMAQQQYQTQQAHIQLHQQQLAAQAGALGLLKNTGAGWGPLQRLIGGSKP